MVNDFTELDFFRDKRLVEDPYPYYEAMRQQCPVTREDHHGVTMITGWDEACAVLNDAETWSSCISVTGPFPGFPVPFEGLGDADITELIEQHRDKLPFSDQLPTLDPPTHTNHRSLLMRLITPKRLKENEDAMWALADQALDTFLAPGRGEFIKGFASPFTLLVIADLLGVPMEDRDKFVKGIREHSGGGIGGTGKESLAHSPLEFLYGLFSDYVRDRRREPRDDVLTGLATATYPDGSIPEVEDVARVASNVFSAGQETTVRLLGAALQTLGERPDIQAQLRKDRSLIPNFIEESLRHREPGQGRLPDEPGAGQCRRRRPARRHHGDGGAGRRQPRSAPVRRPHHLRPGPQERPPAHLVRTGHPQLPRRAAGARRNPGGDRAACSTARPTSGSTRVCTVRRMTAATNMFRPTSCAA